MASTDSEQLRCIVCLWPLHKTQCGTDVDYFRSPRLSKGEARSLILIDEHNLGKGPYPFTNKSFTLREALRRFGVADSSSVKSLVDPLEQNKTLDLEQSKIALLFRFFLRSYRYEDAFSAYIGRQTEGSLTINAHHYAAQCLFPMLCKVPSGAPAFRLPPGETEVLRYARSFCDESSVYTAVSLIGGGLTDKMERGVLPDSERDKFDELMRTHKRVIFRNQDSWEKFDMHIMLEEAGATYYHRGVWKMPEGATEGNEFFLLSTTGFFV